MLCKNDISLYLVPNITNTKTQYNLVINSTDTKWFLQFIKYKICCTISYTKTTAGTIYLNQIICTITGRHYIL